MQAKMRAFTEATGRARRYDREGIASVKQTVKKTGASLETGAKKTKGWQDRHAERYYEEVRNRRPFSDAKLIVKNTEGFTEEDIEEIRNHVFIKEQPRDGGLKRFDVDYEQAEVWQRLVSGNSIKKSDIIFLKHELMELTIMKKDGIVYEEAHNKTQEVYNWQKAVKEENS